MLKKILLTVLFVALATGTVYSWQSVDFSQKTARFFNVAFGDQSSMGNPRAPRTMAETNGGDMSRPGVPNRQEGRSNPSAMTEGSGRGASPDSAMNGRRGGGPEGGGHGPGSIISLGNVAKYTVIMAFLAMLTYLSDQWIRKKKRVRRGTV